MKTISKFGFATVFVAVLFFSCKKTEETPTEAPSETSMNESISSSAAVEKKDSDRKFIRTADIKFKVKNVPQSTYAIENVTNKFGGFVTYTNLQSTISEKKGIKISQDSTLEITKYSVENNITIRVPNTRLDTVIKTIAKQIDFLDYRVIKADDVSLQFLSNKLAQNRATNHESRLENAIDKKGKKLNDIVDAENDLDSKSEANDTKKLENLSLQDQVNFSTLTLEIYQLETIKKEKVANVIEYRQNIGSRIWDNIKSGWYMLEAIIAFIFELWAIALIGFAIWFGYKKFKKI